MRFADKNLSTQEVVNLIEAAAEIGITTHHSSSEYSSYDLYSAALRTAECKNSIRHIVKVASPHFEDDAFNSVTLEQRVDQQLDALGIECIDVLQWLVRSKPINDTDRLQTLNRQRDEIEQAFANLKHKGKIKSVYSFPYSIEFARQVLQFECVDGLTAYLNLEEQDYAEFANSGPFIAIRPLFAGQSLTSSEGPAAKTEKIGECLRAVYTSDSVLSAIVGINKVEQLDAFRIFAA